MANKIKTEQFLFVNSFENDNNTHYNSFYLKKIFFRTKHKVA
jgi:hypothetical protein